MQHIICILYAYYMHIICICEYMQMIQMIVYVYICDTSQEGNEVPWYLGAKCRGSGCGDIPALGVAGLENRPAMESPRSSKIKLNIPIYLSYTFHCLHHPPSTPSNPRYKKYSIHRSHVVLRALGSLGILAREQLLPDSWSCTSTICMNITWTGWTG